MQKQAALNDILLSTNSDAQELMKDLYNNADEDTIRALQILADSGYHFTKDFFTDSKIVGFADDAKDFLQQYINEQLEDNLDQTLNDIIPDLVKTEENQEAIRNSFSDADKKTFVNDYLLQAGDKVYKDEAVANVSRLWMEDIMQDETLYPYTMYTLMKDKGIRDYYVNDKDVVDAIVDSMELEELEIPVTEEVLLDQSRQILEALRNEYNVYQSPDGLIIMEK